MVLDFSFNLEYALNKTKQEGYFFTEQGVTEEFRRELETEIDSLYLEEGDHIKRPINRGKPWEVRQFHERFYCEAKDDLVPTATRLILHLAQEVQRLYPLFPELTRWEMTEVGYQLYREGSGFISPHRDRKNDKMLSVTITIKGTNEVIMYETMHDPNDYRSNNLRDIFRFTTIPGSLMFLRAPGFGNGKQVIHSVSPPAGGDRKILNLRMRPDVLKSPAEFAGM
ncbi:hypothetical protein COV20_03115 [Candidatus Woesearchaeota archaeon CG10_big_fil_rev_8_21_14_0_10_45_16]|nr:MAG: hypothetical protein COV20_03115 [Candidatus Woesearchaeota archaeon CG10_big_fil_rev_8_21_14_0_10_45_16]